MSMIHNSLHRHMSSEIFKKMGDIHRSWFSSLKNYIDMKNINGGVRYSSVYKEWFIAHNSECYHDIKTLVDSVDNIKQFFLYCNMQLPDIINSDCHKLLLNAIHVYLCSHHAYDILQLTREDYRVNAFSWLSLDDLSVIQKEDEFKLFENDITIYNSMPMSMLMCDSHDVVNMYLGYALYLMAKKEGVQPFHEHWLEMFKKQKPEIYEQFLIFNIQEHPFAWVDDVYAFFKNTSQLEELVEVPLMINH